MSAPTKFDQPMSTAILVRLTPQLHELVHEAAVIEETTATDFIRDAAIHRLGQLGLVPIVTCPDHIGGDVDQEDDET